MDGFTHSSCAFCCNSLCTPFEFYLLILSSCAGVLGGEACCWDEGMLAWQSTDLQLF